jgi:hypothetical protein
VSWLESHQSLRDHPKKDRLAELLFNGSVQNDVADLAAVGILHCLWWWALDYAQDGDLAKFSDRQIAKGCGWTGDATLLVASLIDAGFVEKKPRRIHDWMEYGGTLIAKKARDAARKRESRKRDVQRTSVGSPRDGAGTDLPTYLPKSFAALKTGQVPVHNSKKPICPTCNAELCDDGDGSGNVHCPVCPAEAIA